MAHNTATALQTFFDRVVPIIIIITSIIAIVVVLFVKTWRDGQGDEQDIETVGEGNTAEPEANELAAQVTAADRAQEAEQAAVVSTARAAVGAEADAEKAEAEKAEAEAQVEAEKAEAEAQAEAAAVADAASAQEEATAVDEFNGIKSAYESHLAEIQRMEESYAVVLVTLHNGLGLFSSPETEKMESFVKFSNLVLDSKAELITIGTRLSDSVNRLQVYPQHRALYEPWRHANVAASVDDKRFRLEHSYNLSKLVPPEYPGAVGWRCRDDGGCRDGNKCHKTRGVCLSPVWGVPCHTKFVLKKSPHYEVELLCDQDLPCDENGICRNPTF